MGSTNSERWKQGFTRRSAFCELSYPRTHIFHVHKAICHRDLLTACDQDENSICFGQFLCPSSGVFHCTHKNCVCHTDLLTACEQDQNETAVPSWSRCQQNSMTYTIAVCTMETPDDGQRKRPKHVEFHSKNKFENLVHLVCFIIRNVSRCTVTRTSNRTDTIRYHREEGLIYYKAMLTHNSRVLMHRGNVVSHIFCIEIIR
jgi:hypothetical protein